MAKKIKKLVQFSKSLQPKMKELGVFENPVIAKKKRYNKNKKKSWRKNIDISDIKEAQEEEWLEERQGGPLSEKKFDDLFVLDDGNVSTSRGKKILATKKESRTKKIVEPVKRIDRLAKDKPLRCHELILNGLPGAKPVSVKKGLMQQQIPKRLRRAQKLTTNTLKAHLMRETIFEQKKKDRDRKRNKLKSDGFARDLWENKDKELERFNDVARTFMKDTLNHYRGHTNQFTLVRPKSLKKPPSQAEAIVVPHGGASYNPSLKDHKVLLKKAKVFKQKELRKKEKEMKFIKKCLPPAGVRITEEERVAELMEGLPFAQEANPPEEEESGTGDNQESSSWSGRAPPKPKTVLQRKRSKIAKVKEASRLKKKERKTREAKVYMLRSIKQEIEAQESEQEKARVAKLKKEQEDAYKTKRLSKCKYVEPNVVVPPEKDLSSTLLTVKPKAFGIKDLFNNFQRRNIIEPRGDYCKPKAKKRKSYYKKGVKIAMEELVSSL